MNRSTLQEQLRGYRNVSAPSHNNMGIPIIHPEDVKPIPRELANARDWNDIRNAIDTLL